MNKIGSFIQAIFCLLLLFTGCKEDDMGLNRPKTEADSPMDAIFELNLAIQGQNNTYPDHNTIGNDMEQSIHSMQLFVVPLNDNNEEMWNNLQFGEATNLKDFQNPITVQVSDFAFNSIHVYVGANMNKQQVNAFIKSKTGYYEMTKTSFPTYYSAINQLAPFSAPWQQELYRKPENIVMFATNVLTANSNDVTEVKDEETGEIKKIINLGTATLKRVVAKVLLTCETVNGSLDVSNEIAPGAVPGVGYVKTVKDLKDPDNLGPTGWIRQQDVYYFINNMPRRVKFLQEYEELEGEKKLKPNYNLKDVIVQQLGVKFSPITFNRETIKNVFIHYDIDELYKRNQSFRQSQIWGLC
ncbi:exported protein [gut metagenome]|uniref:Exported protein n=1 Tax=gut metagenome TaxID=749906 RepID=J9H4W1_9ZZZZ